MINYLRMRNSGNSEYFDEHHLCESLTFDPLRGALYMVSKNYCQCIFIAQILRVLKDEVREIHASVRLNPYMGDEGRVSSDDIQGATLLPEKLSLECIEVMLINKEEEEHNDDIVAFWNQIILKSQQTIKQLQFPFGSPLS